MEHVQTYSYFGSDYMYISQYTVYLVMSFRHIYDLLVCAIWVRHAYNVMFNFAPCVGKVSLKIGVSSLYSSFKCRPASERLARH